jgi:hypothetical protein
MRIVAAAGLAVVLTFGLLAFGAARADDAIAPERLALARQVLDLSGTSKIYDDYGKNLDTVIAQLRQSMPGLDETTVADLKKIATEEFNAARPEMIDGTIKIYARHFTENDLKALVAFYKSDAGQHFAAELPAVSTECMQLNVTFSRRFMARFQQYIAAKIAGQNTSQDKDKKDK